MFWTGFILGGLLGLFIGGICIVMADDDAHNDRR